VGKSFSDQSTTGDECFQIASNDAATLGLFVKTNAYFLHPRAQPTEPEQRQGRLVRASMTSAPTTKPKWWSGVLFPP